MNEADGHTRRWRTLSSDVRERLRAGSLIPTPDQRQLAATWAKLREQLRPDDDLEERRPDRN